MEEKKGKKKQTLTISSTKSYSSPNYPKDSQKKSFVIEKKISGKKNDRRFFSRNDNTGKTSSSFKKEQFRSKGISTNNQAVNRNFEIRKKAEERAKKRFKNLDKEETLHAKKTSLGKSKSSVSKREYKLTISKALDDEAMEGKGRSLASVRRARLKEKQSQISETKKTETKKIVHEVNIPDKITIKELSNRMAMQASAIIKHLLGMGVVATINHNIDGDTAEYLVKEFGNIPIREKNLI